MLVLIFPFHTAQKMKNFKKIKKSTWRYHNFTQLYQKSWSYAILFLRYGVWRMQLLFFILSYFLPSPPNSPKNEFFKKNEKWKEKKTPGDIILHKCTKNHDMLYCSWDMVRDRWNYFSFWAIFCTFTPLTA